MIMLRKIGVAERVDQHHVAQRVRKRSGWYRGALVAFGLQRIQNDH